MSTPEEILRGDNSQEKKKKPPPKKEKPHSTTTTEWSIEAKPWADVSVDGNDIQPFPVHPKKGAQTTWRAFRGFGRPLKVQTGFSTFHHFRGYGRPINAPFYWA